MPDGPVACVKMAAIVACAVTSACAPVAPDVQPVARREPQISLIFEETRLGEVVRHIGETYGGNLVLMNGIEDRPIEMVRFRRVTYEQAATRLAELAACALQKCPHYLFLYPPGYEPLTTLSLEGRIDPAYDDVRAAVTFGAGTRLLTAFMWIGQALDITVVADNVLAEARCGELSLEEIPIQAVLEALLKSARVVGGHVISTDEYIFAYASHHKLPTTTLLNGDTLDARQKAFLDARVNVRLPRPPAGSTSFELSDVPWRLGEVVDSLSKQLGIRIVADKDVAELPVNPAIFNNVRVKTALDLLIWQWPISGFGYEITRDHIVIRRARNDT